MTKKQLERLVGTIVTATVVALTADQPADYVPDKEEAKNEEEVARSLVGTAIKTLRPQLIAEATKMLRVAAPAAETTETTVS